MRIPLGPVGTPAEGKPTLHTSQIRSYGAGGFLLRDQEELRGCPKQYKAKYVDHSVAAGQSSEAMEYGSMFHRVMYLMEEEAIGPEEALERCWPASLDPKMWVEAVQDLEQYMARGTPSARMGTVAVETELIGLLYVDEKFGEVYFGGVLDWLGIDVNEPNTLHVVDYKTNRFPPSQEDVEGDVQLKSYDWLVRQNWQKLGMVAPTPNVVVHLDAIKFREMEARFSEQTIDEWQAWAVAIARRILRDEKGEPKLSPGCSWCPIKLDCGLYKSLPGVGTVVLERRNQTALEDLWTWREEAANVVKQLKAGIDEVDATIKTKAITDGRVVMHGQIWQEEPTSSEEFDKRALHEVLGDLFYSVIGVGKGKVDELVRGNPQLRDRVLRTRERMVTGSKVVKKKLEDADD